MSLKSIPKMKSVMTAFPFSIESNAPISAARHAMNAHRIHHLPVLQEGKLVALLSERDVSLAEKMMAADPEADEFRVRDACTHNPFTCSLDADLDQVCLEMAERRIGSVVVLKDDKVAGIFTVNDACRCLGEVLQSQFPRVVGDPEAA